MEPRLEGIYCRWVRTGRQGKASFFYVLYVRLLLTVIYASPGEKCGRIEPGDGLPVRHTIFEGLNAANAVANSSVCVYSKIPVAIGSRRAGIDRYDAISKKVAGAKLALTRRHACAGGLRRSCHLQRDLHARGSSGGRFLAQAGELGRGRILRFHAREPG